MEGYLFDTNIVSQWFRGNSLVVKRVEAIPSDALLYISSITIGEIEFGHACVRSPDKAKQAEFRRWIKEHLEDQELPLEASTGIYYGMFKCELFRKFPPRGKKKRPESCFDDVTGKDLGIDENDLWLVSQACDHNLIFVTNDRMTRIKEIVGDRVKIDSWPVDNP
jgi:predicted nucleic acid-binding protein